MADRVGVIVDGPGDYAALKSKFLGSGMIVLKADGPRGHTVALHEIVRSANKQVAQLHRLGCSKVIVLFDFEMRMESYSTSLSMLAQMVSKMQYAVPVLLSAANRMIENWYLADIEGIARLRGLIRKGVLQKKYEGTHGKDNLKRLFVKGVSYNEVVHGPQLFREVRFTVAEKNSLSLAKFLGQVRT
jgi:hypothetical protein